MTSGPDDPVAIAQAVQGLLVGAVASDADREADALEPLTRDELVYVARALGRIYVAAARSRGISDKAILDVGDGALDIAIRHDLQQDLDHLGDDGR
jgi:hypothetical protein